MKWRGFIATAWLMLTDSGTNVKGKKNEAGSLDYLNNLAAIPKTPCGYTQNTLRLYPKHLTPIRKMESSKFAEAEGHEGADALDDVAMAATIEEDADGTAGTGL